MKGLGAWPMPVPRNKDIDSAGDTSAAVMVVAVRVLSEVYTRGMYDIYSIKVTNDDVSC